jgi:hypothetical protein
MTATAGGRVSVEERQAEVQVRLEAELRRIIDSGEYAAWFSKMASFHRYSAGVVGVSQRSQCSGCACGDAGSGEGGGGSGRGVAGPVAAGDDGPAGGCAGGDAYEFGEHCGWEFEGELAQRGGAGEAGWDADGSEPTAEGVFADVTSGSSTGEQPAGLELVGDAVGAHDGQLLGEGGERFDELDGRAGQGDGEVPPLRVVRSLRVSAAIRVTGWA